MEIVARGLISFNKEVFQKCKHYVTEETVFVPSGYTQCKSCGILLRKGDVEYFYSSLAGEQIEQSMVPWDYDTV